MVSISKPRIGRLLLALALTFAGTVSAQMVPGDGDKSAQPLQTDGTLLQEPAKQATPAPKTQTKVPTTGGRWVPRVNASTCPKGATAYPDEKKGGVKCWVKSK